MPRGPAVLTPSRLAIAPGSTHYNILEAPLLAGSIATFCG